MKIRSDFVTNSSSSSYIIGHKDSDTTLDSVYTLIHNIYLQLYSKRDKAIAFIKMHPELRIEYEVVGASNRFPMRGFARFICIENKDSNLNKQQSYIFSQLTEVLGFNVEHTTFSLRDMRWVAQCKTYDEYLEFFSQSFDIVAPFVLIDYSVPSNPLPQYMYYKPDSILFARNERNSVLSHIKGSAEFIFKSGGVCSRCVARNYDYDFCKQCPSVTKEIKAKKVPKEQAVAYLLGKIGIITDTSMLQDYVTENLKTHCLYFVESV